MIYVIFAVVWLALAAYTHPHLDMRIATWICVAEVENTMSVLCGRVAWTLPGM